MALPKTQLTSRKRMQPLSLRRNFSWTFLGDITFGVCQWAMLAVLAKLVSPAQVGNYAFGLAVTAPVILFANLSLRQVEATDVRRAHSFGEYFGLRLIMLGLSVAVIIGITAIIHPSREVALVIAMVTVAKIFDSLSDIMYGLQQQNERMDYISISRITQGILQLVILGVTVYFTRSLVWGTAVVAVGSGLVTAFYDVPMTARIANHVPVVSDGQMGVAFSAIHSFALLKPSWYLPPLWVLARLSLPLGFVAVLGMLNVNIPRYFVQDYAGARELGIFSAMWSMLHPVGLATGSIISSVMPRMARYYVESIRDFKRVFFMLLTLAFISATVGVVGAHFFGRQVLGALFRPEYGSHPVTFEWMMVAAGMIYFTSVLNGAISAARKFKAQPYIILVAALANTFACYLLVPRFGVLGATWAYCLGCAIWMVGFGVMGFLAIRAAEQRDVVT